MILRDFAEVHRTRNNERQTPTIQYSVSLVDSKGVEARGGDAPFKVVGKGLLVEKDPRVVIFPIEPILQLFDGNHRRVDVRVTRKHEERRICARRRGRRFVSIVVEVWRGVEIVVVVRGNCGALRMRRQFGEGNVGVVRVQS